MIFCKKLIGFIIFNLLLTTLTLSEPFSLPEAKAIRWDGPITVDGDMSEDSWKQSGFPYHLYDYISGEVPANPTEFSILYNNDTLYFGMICHESKMDKTLGSHTTDMDIIYFDDDIEVFIVPWESTPEGKFHHFMLNIAGARAADSLSNYGHPERADSQMVPWEGKVRKYADRWTAEFAIPLNVLVPAMGNESFWRLNIGRSNPWTHQFSSWSKTTGSFHDSLRYGKLTGIDLNGKFIGFKATVSPVINTLATAPAVFTLSSAASKYQQPVQIIPIPYQVNYNQPDFVLNSETKILLGERAPEGNLQAIDDLNQELKDLYGFELPVQRVKENQIGLIENAIILGEPGKNPVLDTLLQKEKLKIDAATPGPEGYILKTSPQNVLVAGSDDAGTYYGTQSLIQLLYKSSQDGKIHIKGVNAWDKPAFKVRMVHFFIDKDSPVTHRKMIEKIFARYKYNNILIEAEHGVAWKSHSEITSKTALDPEEVTKLVKFAKRHYLTVTPLIQSMGHGAWMFRYGNNLDFAEDSTRPDVYCPLNPKAYDFLFDIMDEAIEVFDHPEYIHIGHDEHDNYNPFPVHPECKAVGDEQLYYMDTLHIYQHLKSKGIKCMMWTDELEGKSFHPYLNALPRDILMTTWNYRDLNEFRSVEFLQKKGFQVLGCTAHRPMNIVNFSKWAENQKALGMMFTTWAGYGDNRTVVEREFKQIMAYIIQADFAWNPNHRIPAENDKIGTLPYYPGQVLREIWYPESRKPFSRSGFAVNLASYANTPLVDSDKKPALAGYGVGNDFSALAAQAKNSNLPFMDNNHYQLSYAKGIPVGIMLKGPGSAKSFPDKVTHIKIDQYASELNFLHTLLHPTKKNLKIGLYRIHYDDGTFQEISLINFQNITAWTDWETYFYGDMAWIGELKSNESVMLRAYCWVNPYPSKKIQSIDFESVNGVSSPLLLAISGISPQ